MASLLIHNIGMLATATGSAAKAGAAQGEICILRNAYVAVQDDTITAVGEGAFPQAFLTEGCTLIDAQGKLLTAGLVDAHTHLVFGGWREDELALKLHGVPYLDILAQGGGILSTVRATRKASEDELYDKTARPWTPCSPTAPPPARPRAATGWTWKTSSSNCGSSIA